ncbi:MAG TPA: hypothetical protein VHB68_17270 [Steroidobacteraceae bacterium]|nr:hypothetical protein [Steroidobacteraceae bacterium]
MILVGGQALAFWATYYRIPAPATAVTKDVDFLGTRADVERLARGLGAKATFRRQRDLTLLEGQIEKDLPGGDYVNIDVLSRVYGDISTDNITKHAIVAESPAGKFRVMHPMDVLQGRLENVYGLAEKQDEHGIAQLQLAIAMAREFLSDIATRETSPKKAARPVTLRHLRRIETLALSDAGRKLAKRYNVHVADAIDPLPLLHLEPFTTRKLPQLLQLMSAQRQEQVAAAVKKRGG